MRIRSRLRLLLAATAAITAALLTLGAAGLLGGGASDALLKRVRLEADLLVQTLRQSAPDADRQAFALEAGRRLDLRVTLVARDGTVLGDSARDRAGLATLGNHLDRPEIVAAARHREGESRRRSESTGIDYLYVARRVDGAAPVGFVRLALPIERLTAARARMRTTLLLLAGATFVVVLGAAWPLAGRLTRPVEVMSATAERAAGGEFHLDVPWERSDEISRLAAAVDRMRRALLGQIEDSERERRVLLSVIGGMKEGLVLVDADRKVRLANDAFRSIFGVSFDPNGHLLAEVIRNPTVMRDLDAALEEEHRASASVVQAADTGRAYELRVTPLPAAAGGRPGALILFLDITRLEALERVRREFVANVSHELRTPLTSIKAFVETLIEGGLRDPDNSLRFLDIVARHADRMQALIDDLTDLSLIETGAVRLAIGPVDVREVAEEVVAQSAPRRAGSNVEVLLELPPGWRVRADRRRLEQILINLLDNAVKFNRPGGTVRLTGADVGGRRLVRVEDTGFGIPAESLDKIFNRFYRVDASRAREAGGTGLGLAIVKHLMRLHAGGVTATSELGRGSVFTLDFPHPGLDEKKGPDVPPDAGPA